MIARFNMPLTLNRRRLVNFNPSVTFYLIVLNVLFFLAFFIWQLADLNAAVNALMNYIALQPKGFIQNGIFWTVLTSIFMHGSFFHLFANMVTLFSIGGFVEKLLGRKRYLLFYLLAGIFAGLFFVASSLLLASDFLSYAVGASGALFALVGFLMIITPNLPLFIFFIPIPVKIKYAAPGILILLWIISLSPVVFGGQQLPIGNVAHLGGFLAGIVYGLYIKKHYRNKVELISRHFS